MELTRRDAVAVLAAAGVGIGSGIALSQRSNGGGEPGPLDAHERSTFVALARVLYPSELDGIEPFVERVLEGRLDADPARAAGIADAIAYLDDYARAWYGEPFADLDRAARDEALRRMNADVADPDPHGSDVERVRYYLVNELLFALYTTPTGGRLVGLENPPGYPGGLTSYQRGSRP